MKQGKKEVYNMYIYVYIYIYIHIYKLYYIYIYTYIYIIITNIIRENVLNSIHVYNPKDRYKIQESR